VANLLQGSVRRQADRIKITAQLVAANRDTHLWADSYDRRLSDIFAIQEEIAQNIAGALQLTLKPAEKRAIEKVHTTDVKAYDYYLRGREFLYRLGQQNIEFARQMFSQAIEIDASYALAQAGIADCYSFLYETWAKNRKANLAEARLASQRALQLDPDLAEARASYGLALSLSQQYEEAEEEFERALRLDPKLYEAYYYYARNCFRQGELEKAARLFEQASIVRPEDYQALALLSSTLRGLGREEETRSAERRALANIERRLELNPDDRRALYLGAGLAVMLNEVERGIEWAERALEMGQEEPVVFYNVACVYSLSGMPEKAMDCLEKAIELGEPQKEWIRHDSDLDSLRGYSRFQLLLERIESSNSNEVD
jgi:tetratricopeptide (TPR) repeat protein